MGIERVGIRKGLAVVGCQSHRRTEVTTASPAVICYLVLGVKKDREMLEVRRDGGMWRLGKVGTGAVRFGWPLNLLLTSTVMRGHLFPVFFTKTNESNLHNKISENYMKSSRV